MTCILDLEIGSLKSNRRCRLLQNMDSLYKAPAHQEVKHLKEKMLNTMFPAHSKSAHGGETESLESDVLQGMLTRIIVLRQFLDRGRHG